MALLADWTRLAWAVAAAYGMNFQTVSTAEKLKSSPARLIGPNPQGNYTEGPSLPGGYVTVDGQQVPGPLLRSALNYVNDALQRMAETIQADGEAGSTAIILTAKHGQSPLDNNQLQRIDDGPVIAGVNAVWAARHPGSPALIVPRGRRRRAAVVAVRPLAGGD
jgi:hypothetical protein